MSSSNSIGSNNKKRPREDQENELKRINNATKDKVTNLERKELLTIHSRNYSSQLKLPFELRKFQERQYKIASEIAQGGNIYNHQEVVDEDGEIYAGLENDFDDISKLEMAKLISVKTFSQLLENPPRELPSLDDPQVHWQMVSYCSKICEIMWNILGEPNLATALAPFIAKDWTIQKIVLRMDIIRRLLKTFRIENYNEIYQYSTTGASKRWNLIAHLFRSECYLLYVRQGFLVMLGALSNDYDLKKDEYFDDIEEKTIEELSVEEKFLCYKDKLAQHYNPELHSRLEFMRNFGECLNIYEFNISLRSLSTKWNEAQPSKKVRSYVHILLYEFVHLWLRPMEKRLKQGQLTRDFIRPYDVDRKMKSIELTQEFFSNAATVFTYLERSLLIKKTMNLTDGLHIITVPIPVEWRKKLFNWMTNELLRNFSVSRVIDLIKKQVYMLILRPGEQEVYMRENQGIESGDFSGVFELCRTSIQTSYWQSKAFASGFGPYLITGDEPASLINNNNEGKSENSKRKNEGIVAKFNEKNYVRDIIILALFNQYSLNDFDFKWWDFTMIFETDFFKAKRKREESQMPIIVNSGGMFYVLHQQKRCFEYRHADEAILCWIILMRHYHYDSQREKILFVSKQQGVFPLSDIFDLLENSLFISQEEIDDRIHIITTFEEKLLEQQEQQQQ